jgi:hypothetical protein
VAARLQRAEFLGTLQTCRHLILLQPLRQMTAITYEKQFETRSQFFCSKA